MSLTREERETVIIYCPDSVTVWTTLPAHWRKLHRLKKQALSWTPSKDQAGKELGGEATFPIEMFRWPLKGARRTGRVLSPEHLAKLQAGRKEKHVST